METPHATDEIDTDAAGFQWPDAYGVSATGASLIRPDGIIAWRSNGTATVNGMIDALNRTLDIDVSP